MSNIDWRAFWASFATIIIALIIYGIIIEPIIKKYKIQVVRADGDEKGTPAQGATKA